MYFNGGDGDGDGEGQGEGLLLSARSGGGRASSSKTKTKKKMMSDFVFGMRTEFAQEEGQEEGQFVFRSLGVDETRGGFQGGFRGGDFSDDLSGGNVFVQGQWNRHGNSYRDIDVGAVNLATLCAEGPFGQEKEELVKKQSQTKEISSSFDAHAVEPAPNSNKPIFRADPTWQLMGGKKNKKKGMGWSPTRRLIRQDVSDDVVVAFLVTTLTALTVSSNVVFRPVVECQFDGVYELQGVVDGCDVVYSIAVTKVQVASATNHQQQHQQQQLKNGHGKEWRNRLALDFKRLSGGHMSISATASFLRLLNDTFSDILEPLIVKKRSRRIGFSGKRKAASLTGTDQAKMGKKASSKKMRKISMTMQDRKTVAVDKDLLVDMATLVAKCKNFPDQLSSVLEVVVAATNGAATAAPAPSTDGAAVGAAVGETISPAPTPGVVACKVDVDEVAKFVKTTAIPLLTSTPADEKATRYLLCRVISNLVRFASSSAASAAPVASASLHVPWMTAACETLVRHVLEPICEHTPTQALEDAVLLREAIRGVEAIATTFDCPQSCRTALQRFSLSADPVVSASAGVIGIVGSKC